MSTDLAGGYVSANGHVVEPADLWTTRRYKPFRELALNIKTHKTIDFYVIDELDPIAVGLDRAALEQTITGRVDTPVRHTETRPGASNPQERLKDYHLDNLRVEIIYTNQRSPMFYRIGGAENINARPFKSTTTD